MLIRKNIRDLGKDLEDCKNLLFRLRRILINNKEYSTDNYSEEVFEEIEEIKKLILNCDLMNSNYSFYGIDIKENDFLKLNYDIYFSYLTKLLLEICYLRRKKLEKIRYYFSPISILTILSNLESLCNDIINSKGISNDNWL